MQEFEQLEAKLDATSARKEELDTEITRLSASGDYEALVAATEQLATASTQVRRSVVRIAVYSNAGIKKHRQPRGLACAG